MKTRLLFVGCMSVVAGKPVVITFTTLSFVSTLVQAAVLWQSTSAFHIDAVLLLGGYVWSDGEKIISFSLHAC